MSRSYGFFTLLAVVAISIVFGMVLGGRLNAPEVVFAAPADTVTGPLRDGDPTRPLAPAMVTDGRMDFADIAEAALPAVVSVTNTQLRPAGSDPRGGETPENLLEEFFERFRGPREPEQDLPPRGEPRERRENSAGSGFLISADGYLMSNNHVVEGADRLVVTLQDGTQYDARVVGTDPAIDFALLKIDAPDVDFPYLPLGDSDALRVGEWVLAIGNPLEFSHSVTVGVLPPL